MYCFLYGPRTVANSKKIEYLTLNSGPYFTTDIELIGKQTFYSRLEIEIFANTRAKTKKNRILSLSRGNILCLHTTCATNALYLYKLTTEEEEIKYSIDKLIEQKTEIEQKITEKIGSLRSDLAKVQKEIKAKQKNLFFVNKE